MMLNLTYFSPKIEKRASLIDGRGLFATAAITKGEVVVVKGGGSSGIGLARNSAHRKFRSRRTSLLVPRRQPSARAA